MVGVCKCNIIILCVRPWIRRLPICSLRYHHLNNWADSLAASLPLMVRVCESNIIFPCVRVSVPTSRYLRGLPSAFSILKWQNCHQRLATLERELWTGNPYLIWLNKVILICRHITIVRNPSIPRDIQVPSNQFLCACAVIHLLKAT